MNEALSPAGSIDVLIFVCSQRVKEVFQLSTEKVHSKQQGNTLGIPPSQHVTTTDNNTEETLPFE